MDPTTTKKNLFAHYPTTVDIGAVSVSGVLLALFQVNWINDPLSKTGVEFLTLLNVTLLGLGNKLGKTDTSKSPFYRNAISVGSLAVGSFAAPNIALYLPQEFEVVVSSNAAFYLAGVTLATKVTIYVLYTLVVAGSNYFSKGQLKVPPNPHNNQSPDPVDPPKHPKLMPSFPQKVEEISDFTKEDLLYFHDLLQKPEGQAQLKLRYYRIMLAFLDAFEKHGIPIKDHKIICREIYDDEFNTYKEILSKYVKSAGTTQLDIERLRILHKLFEKNPKEWEIFSEKEQISYTSQILENGLGITTWMDLFLSTTYWSHFGDVKKLDSQGIKLLYNFFEWYGAEKWKSLPVDVQLYCLCEFEKQKLPSLAPLCVCEPSRLMTFLESDSAMEENLSLLYQFFGTKTGKSTWDQQVPLNKKIIYIDQFSNVLKKTCDHLKFEFGLIGLFVKDENILSLCWGIYEKLYIQDEPKCPLKDLFIAYFKHSLKLSDDHVNRYLRYVDLNGLQSYMDMAFLYSAEAVGKLSLNQLNWLEKIVSSSPQSEKIFNELSLTIQEALRKRSEVLKIVLRLEPTDVEEVQKTSKDVIWELYQRADRFKTYPEDIQTALEERFINLGYEPLPPRK